MRTKVGIAALVIMAAVAGQALAGRVQITDTDTSEVVDVIDGGLSTKSELVNENGNPLTIDSTFRVPIVIDVEHHEIHEGDHYFIKGQADISTNLTYFMFVTPDTTTRIHARSHIATEGEFVVEIFEGGTVSANGTELTGINNERDSTNVATLVTYANPTVTGDGDFLWGARTGAGKDATVSLGQGYEIVVKRNETYIFKITKIGVQTLWVDSDFWWYEHAPETD